jgi:hypothetical protein
MAKAFPASVIVVAAVVVIFIADVWCPTTGTDPILEIVPVLLTPETVRSVTKVLMAPLPVVLTTQSPEVVVAARRRANAAEESSFFSGWQPMEEIPIRMEIARLQ